MIENLESVSALVLAELHLTDSFAGGGVEDNGRIRWRCSGWSLCEFQYTGDLSSLCEVNFAKLRRNKQCVLAYLLWRIRKIEEVRWDVGSILPAELKARMSRQVKIRTRRHLTLRNWNSLASTTRLSLRTCKQTLWTVGRIPRSLQRSQRSKFEFYRNLVQ